MIYEYFNRMSAGLRAQMEEVEGGGWRVEGGGWRVEGGGWRVEHEDNKRRRVHAIATLTPTLMPCIHSKTTFVSPSYETSDRSLRILQYVSKTVTA
jgi:hypothetical protein